MATSGFTSWRPAPELADRMSDLAAAPSSPPCDPPPLPFVLSILGYGGAEPSLGSPKGRRGSIRGGFTVLFCERTPPSTERAMQPE